jgi:hypothetical protein
MGRQEAAVLMLVKAGYQSFQGRLDTANGPDCDGVTSAYMGRIVIDLDDRSVIWIELTPSKICPEQQQYIAVETGVTAGGRADDTGHADIVRVVVFDEVLAARCVGY